MQSVVWAILGAALGAGCLFPEETCLVSRFDETPAKARIAGSGDRAMVLWSHVHGDYEALSMYMATVASDGTLGTAVQLDDGHANALVGAWVEEGGLGELGAATAFWGKSDHCFLSPEVPSPYGVVPRPFTAILLPTDGTSAGLAVDVTTTPVGAHTVTYDGTRYHAFWVSEGRMVRHRTVDENGTLGPVHDLGAVPPQDQPDIYNEEICLIPTSDRAGNVVLETGTWTQRYALAVAADGTSNRIWDSPPAWASRHGVFWLGTEVHILGSAGPQNVVVSLDLATAATRTRPLPTEILIPELLGVSAATIYVLDQGELLALDPDLAVTARSTPQGLGSTMALGGLAVPVGSRFTYVHESGQTDPRQGAPKRLQLVQLAANGDEASRVDIDVAAEPVEYEVPCGRGYW